jgi:SIR2-like domain
MAPEVLFGTLTMFGVRFAAEVCDVLGDAQPNAVHAVAAQILRRRGCVWTPNIDNAVERACASAGFEPHRAGRRPLRDRQNNLAPLADARAGTYVKFHGTVEAANTLAFTDRQLIAPLPEREVEALAELGRERLVVFYGYAGADADLADLLDRILVGARDVYWFEPSRWSHDRIREAFPAARDRIKFVPNWESPRPGGDAMSDMAKAFLELAREHGHVPDPRLERLLLDGDRALAQPVLHLDRPSGATQARLVERFGAGGLDDDKTAWALAWKDDIRHGRLRAMPGHIRHRISYSLYHYGSVARLVGWLAGHRSVLRWVWPGQLRNYFITRGCALLLRGRDWSKLRDFVDWAVAFRTDQDGKPNPSDLYYQAQAYRYSLLPTQARTSAEKAIDGLQSAVDAERLAGALYEAGEAAIYLADFNTALGYAFQLRYRRGRYAIARWQAWGAWLETIALAHTGEINRTEEPIAAMTGRFRFEDDQLSLADARTAQLLVARVRLAQTGSLGLGSLDDPTDAARTRRYLDDLDLLRADISIGLGDHDDANRRLIRVRDQAATPVSRACALLGLAELKRLAGPGGTATADAFASIADDAHDRGATWLEGQAILGLHLCDEARAEPRWERLAKAWPRDGGVSLEAVKTTPTQRPRVLWLLTI